MKFYSNIDYGFNKFFTRVFLFYFLEKITSFLYCIYRKYFPAVIMTILIVYSIKDVNFKNSYGIKRIGTYYFTTILHLIFKNYLISIFLERYFIWD